MAVRAGEATRDMIVVKGGAIEILRAHSADSPETVVAHYGPPQFAAELNLLTWQATLTISRPDHVDRRFALCFRRFRAAQLGSGLGSRPRMWSCIFCAASSVWPFLSASRMSRCSA